MRLWTPGWLDRRKRHLSLLLGVMAIGALTLALVSYAGDVGTTSGFEDDDGNLADDAGGPPFDWNGFAPLTWSTDPAAPYRTATATASGWSFKGFEDAAVSSTDTGFAGGVKQDDDCGKEKVGKAPNKDDLKRIYLATKSVGGNVYLTIGWVRIPQNSTSASAHIGYEFNQSDESCGTGSKLVKRTGGDMLIVYDFEGGTSTPHLKLSRWLTTDWVADNSPATLCQVNSSSVAGGCWGDTKDLTDLGFAEGKVNTATVTDELKPSGSDPGPVEFGEAGIDLTGAGVFSNDPAADCLGFGHAYAMGRTSGNSEQAAMTDIDGPGTFTVSRCGSVSVTKAGNDGGSQAGAVFTLYAGSDTTGTVVGTCTVNADGDCLPAFTGLNPGTYTIDETTLPTAGGYTKDSDLPKTFDVAAGQNVELSFTNTAAPGSVKISKVDDAGDPVGGITFTIYSPAGTDGDGPTGDPAGSCTTSSEAGPNKGTCTISGVEAGTYTIDETVPADSGYLKDPTFPKNITVERGTELVVPATDPRAFKAVVIVCRQYDKKLYPSAIKIDGTSAGTSLSAAQAGTASLDETKLCELTAGARSGLTAEPSPSSTTDDNPHSAEINIPHLQP